MRRTSVLKAMLALLCIAFVATAAACGTPEEYTIYGSDAAGDLAGDELPEGEYDGMFHRVRADHTVKPADWSWQVQLVKKVQGCHPPASIVLATYERDGRRLVAFGKYDHRGFWGALPVGEGPVEGEDPVKTETFSGVCVNDRRILVGWISDPRVATFTLKFSNGVAQTLEAETHQYFIAILGLTYPNNTDLEVVEVIARNADGDVIQ